MSTGLIQNFCMILFSSLSVSFYLILILNIQNYAFTLVNWLPVCCFRQILVCMCDTFCYVIICSPLCLHALKRLSIYAIGASCPVLVCMCATTFIFARETKTSSALRAPDAHMTCCCNHKEAHWWQWPLSLGDGERARGWRVGKEEGGSRWNVSSLLHSQWHWPLSK